MEGVGKGLGDIKIVKFYECRLCMGKSKNCLRIFFSYDVSRVTIGETIRDLLNLEVAEDDGLPDAVCQECVAKLVELREFKSKCMNSAKELKKRHEAFLASQFVPVVVLSPGANGNWVPLQLNLPLKAIEQQLGNDVLPKDTPVLGGDDCGLDDNGALNTHISPSVGTDSSAVGGQAEIGLMTGEKCDEHVKQSSGVGVSPLGISQNLLRISSFGSQLEVNVPTKRYRPIAPAPSPTPPAPMATTKEKEETFKPISATKGFWQFMEGGTQAMNCNQSEQSVYTRYICDYCGSRYTNKYSLAFHVQRHVEENKPAVNESVDEQPSKYLSESQEKDSTMNHVEQSLDEAVESVEVSVAPESSVSECGLVGGNKSSGGSEELENDSSGGVKVSVRRRGKVAHPCGKCGRAFIREKNLMKHKCIPFGYKPYECGECGKRYDSKGHLNTHKLTHSDLRLFKCPTCGKGFNYNFALKNHMAIHDGVKPYECEECGKRTITKANLKLHKLKHSNERPFACDVCGKAFKTKHTLILHLDVHGTNQFECSICRRQFKTKQSLRTHMLVHSDLRPYKCNLCPKEFKRKREIKRHLFVHSGVKPYMCEICGREFNAYGNFKLHAAVHIVVDPFKCKVCGKEFQHQKRFDRHAKTHVVSKQ